MPAAEITVLAFGSLAGAIGWAERRIPIAPGESLAAVIARLEAEHPRLAEARSRLRYAVNLAYAAPEQALQPGDELAIIPPVSGGGPAAPSAVALLTRNPLDLAAMCAEVDDPACGGVAAFVGVVRAEQNADGRALEALDYSAHEPMAAAMLQVLADEALRSHDVRHVRVAHRLGLLRIGAASVAVVVAAPHRDSAFAACRALIEQLKQDAPIFKRELWEGGGASWVHEV